MEFAVFGRRIKIGWAHVGIYLLASIFSEALAFLAAHIITNNRMAQNGWIGEMIYQDILMRELVSVSLLFVPVVYISIYVLAKQWKKWSEEDIVSFSALAGLIILILGALGIAIGATKAPDLAIQTATNFILVASMVIAETYIWLNLIWHWKEVKKSVGIVLQLAVILLVPVLLAAFLRAFDLSGADLNSKMIVYGLESLVRDGLSNTDSLAIAAQALLLGLTTCAPLVAYYWTRKDWLWLYPALYPVLLTTIGWLFFREPLSMPLGFWSLLIVVALGIWTMKEQGRLTPLKVKKHAKK